MSRFNLLICLILFALHAHSASSSPEGLAPLVMTGCDDTRPPVVFVHGFLASGDTWATQIQRFASNGHCQDRYFAFDWNSLGAGNADALLDKFIDSVLLVTGSTQVHLVGHSAGGGRGYAYLSDPVRAAKVISYAHIGSNSQPGPAGPAGSVPTMNIYSTADKVVNGADIPGAENVMFTTFDHYEVATSAATFGAFYTFFYGTAPQTTDILASETITIGGKCLTLGENTPSNGVTIEVFASDANGDPIQPALTTFTVGSNGFWGPLEVEKDRIYQFRVTSSAPGFRKVIYYYEPFIRDNPNVYLRTFPPPLSLAGILLGAIPNNDNQGVISIFTATQAVIHGRDQLSLDGIDLATPTLASESASMIALFCYDNGADGNGNGQPIGTFAAFPFLQGADVPIPTSPDKTWTIQFNGRSLPVRNWRSQSDGVVIAVFQDAPQTVGIQAQEGALPVLEIFPNPAGSEVWVMLPAASISPQPPVVFNAGGERMSVAAVAMQPGQWRLDTSRLTAGTYFIALQTDKGLVSGKIQLAR